MRSCPARVGAPNLVGGRRKTQQRGWLSVTESLRLFRYRVSGLFRYRRGASRLGARYVRIKHFFRGFSLEAFRRVVDSVRASRTRDREMSVNVQMLIQSLFVRRVTEGDVRQRQVVVSVLGCRTRDREMSVNVK